mmetsp:Transcript_31680/g.38814  ORF Transcript_31680/g.38814 Transcript_31680/m.38814 type:complete len:107 (-) Transcript_31680:212-532(-)
MTRLNIERARIDVYYGRTDNTTGYKEYSCVVMQTAETSIKYYDDIYEPHSGCNYKILCEVPMNELGRLCADAGVAKPCVVGWVPSPLKERVLRYWKEKSNGTTMCW